MKLSSLPLAAACLVGLTSISPATDAATPKPTPVEFYKTYVVPVVALDSEAGQALLTPQSPDYSPLKESWIAHIIK